MNITKPAPEADGQDRHNLVESTAALAAAAMTVQHVNDVPVVVVPDGFRVDSLEGLLDRPKRTEAMVHLLTLDAFIEYFNKHSLPNSAIFATNHKHEMKLTAILDFHARGEPAWSKHHALFEFPDSKELQAWGGKNEKRMSQEEFAIFLEDNLIDIVSPDGATMLEVATTLQVKKGVEFHSSTRISDGQVQLSYQETLTGSTRKGTVEIPERFTIQIPLFQGGEIYPLEARLRYRLENGKVSFWFSLLRHHKVIDAAFEAMVQKVEVATNTKIMMGIAPPVWA